MLFAPYERFHYVRSPLVEVICQLRFPTILSIGANEPAAFQEAIRRDFPKYMTRQEQLPPKVVKNGTATALEPQKPITNYHFISEDGRWKINLTFERIGLRYVNAVSRKALGLEGRLWDDLIQDQYLGILNQPDVEETEITKCSLDVETPLVGGYKMKLHTGPGLVGGNQGDKEVKFILDGDFSAAGQLAADSVPAKLEDMHRFAVCLFRGAVTDELYQAMGPTPLAE